MKKTLLIAVAALAATACHPDDAGKRHGAIFTGPQATAITLTAGNNVNLPLQQANVSPGTMIRLTPNAAGSTITGLSLPQAQDGDLFVLRNESLTANITLTNQDGTSLATNQFLLTGSAPVVIPPLSSIWIERDVNNTTCAANSPAGCWEMGPGHINAPTFSLGYAQAVELVTSGALSASGKYSQLSVTGTQAYTLANGTVTGQVKVIECTVAASTPVGTLTITTPAGTEPATHVFTQPGQQLTLQWTGAAWHMIGKLRAGQFAVVVGTTVLTGVDMVDAYELSVTGTVTSLTAALQVPNCFVPGERIHFSTPTATGTPVGSIKVVGFTIATGVAATTLGAINATTVTADYVCDSIANGWQNVALTTATYS